MIEEEGWLIELKASAPTWWGRVDSEDGVCGWTTDNQKAIRFAREEDAQTLIDEHGWTEAFPTGHMWCDYSHEWKYYKEFKFTSCQDCGIVQRTDGENGPCRGKVKIGLRADDLETKLYDALYDHPVASPETDPKTWENLKRVQVGVAKRRAQRIMKLLIPFIEEPT